MSIEKHRQFSIRRSIKIDTTITYTQKKKMQQQIEEKKAAFLKGGGKIQIIDNQAMFGSSVRAAHCRLAEGLY